MKKILGFLTVIALFIVCGASALAADNYPYEISDLYFTDLNLNRMANPANSCYANVKVRKTADNSDQAFVICALYDKNNTFINSSFMSCDNFAQGEEKKFGTTVNVPSGKTLGKVKAFVVSDMKNLTPLSSAKGVTANGEEVSNIFTVKGYIRENARSDVSYKPNEALIYITDTPFGGEEYNIIKDYCLTATFEGTEVPEVYTFGSFTIIAENDGNYKVTAFTPDNNYVESDILMYEENTIDWNNLRSGNHSISFRESYESDNVKKYYLSGNSGSFAEIEFLVNGVPLPFNRTTFQKYIDANTNGKITLHDVDSDGKYEVISVDCYVTAKVGSIIASRNRINFTKATGDSSTFLAIDPEDDSVTFKIIYQGNEIGVQDIKQDDILSIKYDVSLKMEDSEFYEIYVSRETAEGKYTENSPYDETFTIGEKKYRFTEGYMAGEQDLIIGNEYTLYLDCFGKIFDVQILESVAQYAVIDKFYRKSSDDDFLSALLYTTDGTELIAEVDFTSSGVTMTEAELAILVYGNNAVNSGVINYSEMTTANKTPIENRVVEYKISPKTGNISTLKLVAVSAAASIDMGTYKADKMTIGSVRLNNSTKIIDAREYYNTPFSATSNNLCILPISSLSDGNDYAAFAFGDLNKSDRSYPLIIITCSGGCYGANTMLAVMNGKSSPFINENDEEMDKAMAFCGGEEVTLVFDSDTKGYEMSTGNKFNYYNLEKGDVIVFEKDENNYIKTFDVVAKARSMNIDEAALKSANNQSDYFIQKTYKTTTPFAIDAARQDEFNNWTGAWAQLNNELGDRSSYFSFPKVMYDRDITRIVYGPVMEVGSDWFTLGSIGYDNNLFTNTALRDGSLGSVIDIDVTKETNVYAYDFSKSIASNKRLAVSEAPSYGAADAVFSDTVYDWTSINEYESNITPFALVRMVDGVAKDILLIMPDDTK